MRRQYDSWLRSLAVLAVAVPALVLARPVSIEDGARQPESNYSSVNDGIRVGHDATVGDLDTVNGSIRVGERTRSGRIESVNGGIHVADGAEVEGIEAVNGGIELERDVVVRGDVESVNGHIQVDAGTRVGGSVRTVNGEIDLAGTTVEGDLSTYQGRIRLDGSRIEGDLHVRRARGVSSWFGREKPTTVVIGPETVIAGDLYFEKKVNLEVAESAQIGAIHGEDQIYE